MAQGNEIVINPEADGRIEPCIVYGTPKPGTCMQIKAATAAVNGSFTFEVYNTASDGQPGPVIVLLPDSNRGKLTTDAYVSGELGEVYWPEVGDELNMLVDASNGDIAIGDKFVIDDGTGKLVAAPTQADVAAGDVGSAAAIASVINDQRRRLAFQAMAALSNPSSDTLLHCRCIANC